MSATPRARVPRYRFEITNLEAMISAMGEAVRAQVAERLSRGMGARGALPRPKDGGAPMQRSGQLAASIASVVRMRRGKLSAVVRATGDRQDIARRKSNDATNTREARRTLAATLTEQHMRTGSVDARFINRRAAARGEVRFKLSSARKRSGTTNSSVAAILSQPPHEIRGRNGGRAQYRVFEPAEIYARAAAGAGDRVRRVRLTT